ncbi:MAG TPA: tetratricopeptide repeat protein [Candidatus Acidoferrum sp.]|nr:tetratricopeptide repeat protein [Candidatus Acidoferrum sp.]
MAGEMREKSVEWRKIVLLAVALAVATVLLYLPALRNGFVSLDDPDYVTRNGHVQQGVTLANVKWAFGTENPVSNWHPLTWISHMLDVNLYGGRAYGHHLTNVLLQAVDVVLLFLLFATATGEAMKSAAVAALFAVHPMNVEAVAWVAERKTVLCMVFFLGACCAHIWYARKPSAGRYALVAALFALGLLSKVMVVTLPLALLLLDYWPLRRMEGEGAAAGSIDWKLALRRCTEKVPLFLMSAGASVMTLYIHHREHALAAGMPKSWLVKNGTYSYLAYLRKFFWPVRLGAFYPHPENSLSWLVVGISGITMLGISAVVWRFRERRYLVAGWLWYLATLFPMVGYVQSGRQGMADRYLYTPMIGVIFGLVWLIADWAKEKNWNPSVLSLLVLLAIAPCVYLTETQIGYWRDSYALFAQTLAVTSRNGMAENSFGSELYERGDFAGAAQHFEAAVEYAPDLAVAHYNLAMIRQRENMATEAEREYRIALRLATDWMEAAQAHNNLGVLYMSEQQYSNATAEFDAAIKLNPAEYNSYMGRGRIELQASQFDAAIGDFAHAARISETPEVFFRLGTAFELKGEARRAAEAYQAALQLAPGFGEAKARLEALRGGKEPPR